jgi:hypothetical protein
LREHAHRDQQRGLARSPRPARQASESSAQPRIEFAATRLAPGDVVRLQRTIGNQAVASLVANSRRRSASTESAGPPVVIQRALSAVPAVPPVAQPILQGLIHGSYTNADNKADLHVNPKADGGPGLTRADMLAVATDVEQAMRLRNVAGGPMGQLLLHPTGAAIVKIVVEMLGEALGGWWSKMAARVRKLARPAANAAAPRSADRLEQRILPEHFAYVDSLRGSNAVSIKPRIVSNNPAYKPTAADFDQDMMATSAAGNAKYAQYKAQASDINEELGASLDITINADQLPAVITLLRG